LRRHQHLAVAQQLILTQPVAQPVVVAPVAQPVMVAPTQTAVIVPGQAVVASSPNLVLQTGTSPPPAALAVGLQAR
jgi:hypothetical protein